MQPEPEFTKLTEDCDEHKKQAGKEFIPLAGRTNTRLCSQSRNREKGIEEFANIIVNESDTVHLHICF